MDGKDEEESSYITLLMIVRWRMSGTIGRTSTLVTRIVLYPGLVRDWVHAAAEPQGAAGAAGATPKRGTSGSKPQRLLGPGQPESSTIRGNDDLKANIDCQDILLLPLSAEDLVRT